MTWPLVSIIVPALNEAESLPELFARTDAVMQTLGQPYEFLVINDGSTDATVEVVSSLKKDHPQIGMISHRINHGKSMALMQGFEAARGQVIVTIDADLQDEPEDIPKLLAGLQNGYELVGGWRQKRNDPAAKRLISKIFNTLIKYVTNKEFKDINCGFKAFTKDVAGCLDLHGDMHRLIPALAASFGFKTTETPVSHKPRKYGESRYMLLRWRGVLDLISFTVLRTTQVRPFHVLCKMGFVCLIASAILAAAVWLFHFLQPGILRFFFRFLFVCLSVFFGSVGLLAPATGLIIECMAINRQDKVWRNSLVANAIYPESSPLKKPS